MGLADSPIRDLVQKLRSLVAPWRIQTQNQSSLLHRSRSTELVDMAEGGYDCCCSECDVSFGEFCHRYCCRSCGRVLCGACVRRGGGSVVIISGDEGGRDGDKVIKYCKSCSKASRKVNVQKVHPSVSPRVSPQPGSPCDVGKICCGNDRRDDDDCGLGDAFEGHDYELSPSEVSSRYLSPVPDYLSRIVVCRSPVRSDEDEAEDSARHFFTPSSEYYNDSSDLDVSSGSAFHESYGFRSAGSSCSESPIRVDINQPRYGHPVQQEKERILLSQNDGVFDQETMGVSLKPERRNRVAESTDGCLDEIVLQSEDGKFKEPLDFENNGHIWSPPAPEDEDDDVDCNYFEYDDDDDDDIGGSSGVFSATSSLNSLLPGKEKHSVEHEEPIRTVIQGHFRALVSQLLEGEGVSVCKEDRTENWLDVISSLAWQAACFVKPDTSKGGSMDPVDYVKVKCIASGRPSESTLVKGVVCTKNIKHKRMTSRYGNARLLLLGGSLEYQRTSNQLASFNMLLEEEMNNIKVIVSKIEVHRPNVLLVEKSVSPYAQEYLLAKEISLVLNVKRPVLDRIAQCTGAVITTVGNLPKARIGQCECFRVEKVHEELEPVNLFHKRPSKTLMFFEGCPRRLGCTVLLKGSCHDELKRVKHVVQYAVFAAYHLSLETSFLADEGATLPKMTVRPGLEMTDRIYSDNAVEPAVCSSPLARFQSEPSIPSLITGSLMGPGDLGSPTMHLDEYTSVLMSMDVRANNVSANVFVDYSVPRGTSSMEQYGDGDTLGFPIVSDDISGHRQTDLLEATFPELVEPGDSGKLDHDDDVSTNYLSAADNHQSILVSYSSRCVVKGTVCERSRLLRIKFYGSFDKPLGRYLHDDLFDQESFCRSCKEPVEAHVLCFTHQLGSLTVNVKRFPLQKLPGERDGKIWMWHRCLKCAYVDGIPPATRRVVMSDAAWGLSFGKFLELSFSNHATANRVASCGHSLQRDCLRFYGYLLWFFVRFLRVCGNMVAFFRFSSIHILSVCLPP
ncbi:putative 1-phosphatidylinositol-3-phosphate 5-kinase FAB1C, partial [Drosera capensis]